SVSSFTVTTTPEPSHVFFLQSPVACMLVGVPAAANVNPHVLLTQLRVLQSGSDEGRAAAALQPTHEPPAVDTRPVQQDVPPARGVWDATPPEQLSVVQGLLSLGTSVSSFPAMTPPEPSQVFFLQSPAVCMLVGVPAAANVKPHIPEVQVRVLQS